MEEQFDQYLMRIRDGMAPPNLQYCDGHRFWKGIPKCKDGWHTAGGPEHDETPGKIASLIVNSVDSCLVGVYLQSALRGVSPFHLKLPV